MTRLFPASVAGIAANLLAAFCSAELVTDEEFVNDVALKRAFQTKCVALKDSGLSLSGAEVRRQLRLQKRFPGTPLFAAGADAKTPAQIYESAKEATLLFGHLYLCGKCDKLHAGIASGIVVSPDGLALTNYHVLESERARFFGAMTSEGVIYGIAEVLASSKQADAALIRLDGAENLPHASFAREAKVGNEVFIVSHPDSHFFTFSTGMVSRHYRAPKSKAPRLQVTADFARGSSGSGVLNRSGHMIGLVTSTNSIYYTQEEEEQKDLQMVVNSCVPLSSLLDLFETKTGAESGKAGGKPPTSPRPVSPTSPPASDRAASADDAPRQP